MKQKMESEYISQGTAAELLEISRTTFWRRVKAGDLPAPIYIGSLPRWHRGDLAAAIEAMARPAA